MLDKIRKFADTVQADEALIIQAKLGDAYPAFHRLMLSETEEQATERMGEFKSKLKKIPVSKLLELHSELTDEQRSILEDLL